MIEQLTSRLRLITKNLAQLKASINLVTEPVIKKALNNRRIDIENRLQTINQLIAQRNINASINLFPDLKLDFVDLRRDIEDEKGDFQQIKHTNKKMLIEEIRVLEKYSSLHDVLPEEKVVNLKEHLEALAVRVQQIQVNEMAEFIDTLKQVNNLRERTQAKVSCFLSYAWPSEERTYECWTQDFIIMFTQHLKAAGIHTYLDVEDSQFGYNSYNHMEKIDDSHFVIVLGTQSLLDKHNIGISSVCVELNRVRARRYRDAVAQRYKVIPIVLSGNMQSALPGEYERYMVVTSFIGKSYTETLKELLRHLYSCGKNQDSYNKIWQNKQFPSLPDSNTVSLYWDQIKQSLPVVTTANSLNTVLPIVLPQKSLIESLPFRRNTAFTGRGILIDQLKANLSGQNNDTDGVMQSITGLGGTGKTQLAVEYAHLAANTNEYDLIWYLSCDTLEKDYARLAYALGISQETKRDEMILAVILKLGQINKWLLIIDEVKDYETIKGLLPSRGGHILLISREREVIPTPPIIVGIFVRAESIQFMVQSLNLVTQSEKNEANTLAHLLGDLPLALAQACAYMKKKDIKISEYILLFTAKRSELWQQEKPPQDYPENIAVTFIMCIEKLSLNAKILLNYMAYFSSSQIPVALLEKLFIAHHAPQSNELSSAAFQEARELLYQYSVIERSEDKAYLSLHQLVQMVIRSHLQTDEERNDYLKRILKGIINLSSVFLRYVLNQLGHLTELRLLENRQTMLNRCRELQPHLESILMYWSKEEALAGSHYPRLSLVYLILGLGYYILNQTTLALAALQQALHLNKDALPPESAAFITADIHLGLSLIYHEHSQNTEINFHLKQALALFTTITQPEYQPHINNRLLNVLDGLGSIALKSNFCEEYMSKEYFHRALDMSTRINGKGHLVTGYFLNKLAEAYHQLGDMSLSRQYAIRHDDFMKAITGKSPDEILSVQLNKLEEALVKIRESKDEHALISLLHEIGKAYFEAEQYPKALSALLEAKEKSLQEYGNQHRGYLDILVKIGHTYLELDEPENALNTFKELFTHVQLLNISTPNRPELGNAYYFLGKTYLGLNDFRMGIFYLNSAADIFKKGVGNNHPILCEIYHQMAICYFQLEDFKQSIRYNQDALTVHELSNSYDHEFKTDLLYNIADCYSALGENKIALQFYKKALPIIKRRGYEETKEIYFNIVEIYLHDHHYKTAVRIYEKLMRAYPEHAGIYQDAGCLFHYLGAIQKKPFYFLRAELCYRKAINIESNASNIIELASFLYVSGRFNDALFYVNQILEDQELISDNTSLYYSHQEIIILPPELRVHPNMLPKRMEFSAPCFAYYLGILIFLKTNQKQEAGKLLTRFSNCMKDNEISDDHLLYLNALANYDNHRHQISVQSLSATHLYKRKFPIPKSLQHQHAAKKIKIRSPVYKSPTSLR